MVSTSPVVFTMRSFLLSALAIVVSFGFAAQAKADYYVWQDSKTGVSLSWPDTWKVVSNADADDVITIMPPSGRGHAACRVRARDDRRYMIFPPELHAEVQQVGYSRGFWDQYLAEYTNPEIYQVYDGAGLGRGFASYTLAAYESAVQGPDMKRRALMFVSNYNGRDYILECSSHQHAFDSYRTIFLSIAKSIDFKKAHTELTAGYYFDFMSDPRIEFEGEEGNNRVQY